jgi:hypothetical protein
VPGDGGTGRCRIPLPHPRRSLQVGEQKRDGARRGAAAVGKAFEIRLPGAIGILGWMSHKAEIY